MSSESEWFQDKTVNEIIDCMLNGLENGQKYSKSVRMFVINIRYLSPKAYVITLEANSITNYHIQVQ